MTTNLPKPNLQDLFAFLSNLGDEFYTGTVAGAQRSLYQKHIAVFCRKCSDKVAMFVVYADEDTLAFSRNVCFPKAINGVFTWKRTAASRSVI
jgi:hypothetical protein